MDKNTIQKIPNKITGCGKYKSPDGYSITVPIFHKIFDDSFFETMAFNTNLYAVQKNLTNFKPTNALEIRSLVAIQNMMMGILKYPRQEMYWQLKFRVNIIVKYYDVNSYQLNETLALMNKFFLLKFICQSSNI